VKIVVLWEDGFPFVDTVAWPQEAIRAALEPSPPPKGKRKPDHIEKEIAFVGIAGLAAVLADVRETVLLTPYGSAFPKAAWPAIYDFLNRGGSWVNVGGSPLSRPVRQNRDGSWHEEVCTTAYSKELFINQAFPIDVSERVERVDWIWEHSAPFHFELGDIPCTRVWELQVRFTDTKDFPREGGSSGSRDASLWVPCYGIKHEPGGSPNDPSFFPKRIAAPIVVIDRLRGPFAGGRWVLVNAELTQPLYDDWLRGLLRLASYGPIELEIRPSLACYYEAEAPSFTIRFRAPRLRGDCSLEVYLYKQEGEPFGVEIEMPDKALALPEDKPFYFQIGPDRGYLNGPGLYRCVVELQIEDDQDDDVLTIAGAATGFWVYDEALLTSGKPLTLNRDYFERDGEPYPVMGTTYMAGDTHRKFLFEPNPYIWDQDFAAMKAAGVNMVRTGLWTAWKRAMLDPGAVDEGVLRAFTAFLLTARKYDIPVIFNFFAFWPEEWGGSNPYLDPRAVEAQKELVAAFAHRFAGVDDLIWDFINEPSFSSPARVWTTRPNYDKFERAAWAKWLQERATDFSPEEAQAADPADVWRERWRLTPNAPLDLPALTDFQDQYIFQGTHPLRVLDYRLFAQEMFNRWTAQMVATVRSNGNPHQLVTVGQDEGGTGDRPNPHFYADVVDFTTNHSWWQNDDLLWDSVMTKTPNKPNLLQETGIMFVENVDGGYRRTPEDCANLLARKLTLAFAAGCAGAIQWLWNTNIYMDSDNEVGIGFLRADGTEKPELEVFRGLAKFFWENRHRMVGRKLEETAIVIPHSNMFSVRNFADAATRRAVRTLEYGMGVPTRTVSEYRIRDIGDPKLIILPSPRILTQTCWEALLAKVADGATLLVTGPIEWDEYRRPISRISALDSGIRLETVPMTHHDDLMVEPFPWHKMSFSGDKIHKVDMDRISGERIEREHYARSPDTQLRFRPIPIPHGTGKILFFRFPIELTDVGDRSVTALYRAVCREAGIFFQPDYEETSRDFLVRRVAFESAALYLVACELSEGGDTDIEDGDHRIRLSVKGDSAMAAYVDYNTGEALSSEYGSVTLERNKKQSKTPKESR